jgi:crotonobetainyl-CoA:carnitine CoA-transferase CaiB-like acyl-CoA transferase
MAEGALSDVVVLELATGVAGPYCGKLLADLGAQVIKCEPPDGDPVRREPPLVAHDSAFFNYLNENKLGIELAAGDRRLVELAKHADIVIHGERGPGADALEGRIRAANPAAVVVSVTPYGRSGPRAGWHSSALTDWATSGYQYIAGDPARGPLALPGFQAEFHAGLHGGVGALAGLWHARNTGEGQDIEISHQEATLNDHSWLTAAWTHQGVIQKRTGSLYAPCADGYIYLFNLVPYPNLFILMERFDLLEDEALQQPMNWAPRFAEVFDAFSAWSATRTKQEIYHAAQELRIAASPVNTMADVAASTQLAARDWFGEVEAGGKRFRATGFPYKLSETPCEVRMPAPRPGQHTAEVLSPTFAFANTDVHPVAQRHSSRDARSEAPLLEPRSSRPGPLTGLRVIEVTANWAGPIAGRHFADLGADVIKVELATKPATRALIYPNDDLWPDHYNRAGYFNKLNRNKRAICLDLSKPEGRDIFLKLVEKADAVLENNAARVMTQLGIDYESLREVNPGLVMCSMAGYGATGPERNYSAYGSNIETSSGLASLLGYDGGQFFGTGSFYADPVTGNHGAVAMLAALHARRKSGRGQWIDIALLEAVSPFFAQQFLEYTVTGVVPEPIGNASRVYAPQGTYQTIGKDCWLSLTVRTDMEWRALCGAIGRDDLGAEGSLAHLEGRRAAAARVDEAIAAWTAGYDHNAAARLLQAAGIAAAPVMQNWELHTDNHLNDRGYFVPVRHPTAGTFAQPGFPWRFERTPGRIERGAPLFAEHNHEVFQGLLDLSDAKIAELYADGVTSPEPIYAAGPTL